MSTYVDIGNRGSFCGKSRNTYGTGEVEEEPCGVGFELEVAVLT